MRLRLTTLARGALLAAALAATSGPAAAHVKWFCGPIDVAASPRALSDVLSPMFLSRGLGFLILVFTGAYIDGHIARRWPRSLSGHPRLETIEALLIRLGVGVYAICLWNDTAVVPWGSGANGAILTPELLDRDRAIALLQLALAFLLVFRGSSLPAALALAALYAAGLVRFGFFHMTDYLYFLGIAGYVALSAPRFDRRPDLRLWRVPLIAASLGVSLMWTAIEKFLYPAWTAIVLAAHPDVTFGFPVPMVIVSAGFVEFSLAFYLLVGRAFLRLAAVALLGLFTSAIPEFGTLDKVGHLPIIAILLVIVVHGTTPLQEATARRAGPPAGFAALIAGLFVVALTGMMASYYGLQRAAGWF